MRNWTSFWLTLGVIGFAVPAFWALERPPQDSGDVAAWVQAIGSIAAIIGAVWIARDGRVRDEQRKVVGAFNAAAIGLAFSRRLLETADATTQNREWIAELVDMHQREIIAARTMLEGVSLSDMPGEEAAARMVNGFRTLHLAETALLLIKRKLAEGSEYPPHAFGVLIADLDQQIAQMESAARTWLAARGW